MDHNIVNYSAVQRHGLLSGCGYGALVSRLLENRRRDVHLHVDLELGASPGEVISDSGTSEPGNYGQPDVENAVQ